jgi:dihydroorotate dehydrogenase electron transfer subunit
VIRSRCEVLSMKRTGVYHSLTLVAPDIADRARPGQFVEVSMPESRTFMLNRPFSIHQASRRGGFAGTLEIVFDPVGPGTEWLTTVEQHQQVDVTGPLGRSFQYPKGLRSCLLVGGGYGVAPLHFLAEELRAHDKDVSMIVGARCHERVFKPIEGKRLASAFAMTTDDGSLGETGFVTDLLPSMIARTRAEVVYACGPNPMLRAVAEYCAELGLPCQVAVEEMMACGLGVCWSCTVPLVSADGASWWNVRACVEGPVFNGARVWWDRWLGEREDRPAPDAAAEADHDGGPAPGEPGFELPAEQSDIAEARR